MFSILAKCFPFGVAYLRIWLAPLLLLLCIGCGPYGCSDGTDWDWCEEGSCPPLGSPAFQLEGATLVDGAWRIDFDSVPLGQPAVLKVQIRNSGDDTLRVRLDGEVPAPYSMELAGMATIEAGARLPLEIAFEPQQAGLFEGKVRLWTNLRDSYVRLHLRGRAVPRDESASLQVEPPGCLHFGSAHVYEVERRSLHLRNVGPAAILIDTLAVAKLARDYRLILPEAAPPLLLAPEDPPLEVALEFRPTTAGFHDGTLRIRSDDPNRPDVDVCLAGAGLPRVECSPSLDFGKAWVGERPSRSAVCKVLGSEGEGGAAPPYVVRSIALDNQRFRASVRNPDGSPGLRKAGYRAGDSFFVDVVYEAGEEGEDHGQILIRSDSDPEVGISLHAVARRSPPCEFAVDPPSLDFGLVALGSERRLSLTIENRLEQGLCHLDGLRLSESSDPGFRLYAPPNASIGAGEGLTIEMGFAPWLEGRASASLQFTLSTEGEELQTVALGGAGLVSCLHVSPSKLDFGSVGLACASREQVISFFNQCDDEVWIDGLEFVDAPGVTVDRASPIAVPSGARFDFSLRYGPKSAEALQGRLQIKRRGAGSIEIPLIGSTSPEELQTDSFVAAAPQVDVLWVVDNSGGMAVFQQAIGQGLPAILSRALALGTDFQIGITTSGLTPSGSCPGGANGGENGRLFPVDGSHPRILHSRMPWQELDSAWRHNTHVGSCHGAEPIYDAAMRALSPPVINHTKVPGTPNPNDGNYGFLRHDAALSIVMLHDEDDSDSVLPVEEYLRFFRSLKPGSRAGAVRVHAISGGKTRGTCSAMACPRCVEGTEQSGGMWLDICTPGISSPETSAPAFERLSDAIFAFETLYFLRGAPTDRNGDFRVDEKDLEVRVGGEALPAHTRSQGTIWRLDRSLSAVAFAPEHHPPAGQPITVHYRKRCL